MMEIGFGVDILIHSVDFVKKDDFLIMEKLCFRPVSAICMRP